VQALGIGATDTGRTRERNEDSLLVDNELGLFIVCDGMGGHAAGEVASSMTVETVASRIRSEPALIERVRSGLEPHAALARLADEAVRRASEEVHRMATSRGEYAGMGTTLTLLIVAGRRAVMAHVGDTRLYLHRGGRIHRLSNDHTMVEELVRGRVMSPEEARKSAHAHVLTRAVGVQPSVVVDTLVLDLMAGDQFLLCSDGLTEHLDDEALLDRWAGDLESMPDELVAAANAAGGRDNITVVAVSVDEEETLAPAVAEVRPGVDVRLDALAATFLFRDLRLAQLQRVANLCEVASLGPGEVLFTDGEIGSGLAVALDGRLEVADASGVRGQIAGGECAGAPFLLEPRRAGATVRAIEPTRVLLISRERFQGLAAKRPWLGLELVRRVGTWCAAALQRVVDEGGARPAELV